MVPKILKNCLIIEIEQDYNRIFQLTPDKICLIGRSPENTIVPRYERSASRYHARIVFEDGEYILYDGGIDPDGQIRPSTGGTFLNGKRCTRSVLSDGCEITFGPNKFIYREDDRIL